MVPRLFVIFIVIIILLLSSYFIFLKKTPLHVLGTPETLTTGLATGYTIQEDKQELENIYYRVCKDKDCAEPEILFEKGESAYIKAFDTEDASLSGTLILPDGTSNTVVFACYWWMLWQDCDPNTIKIPLLQDGKYKAEITAVKEGYNTFKTNITFEAGHIPYNLSPNTCNLNGICDSNESMQSCPQDCDISNSYAIFCRDSDGLNYLVKGKLETNKAHWTPVTYDSCCEQSTEGYQSVDSCNQENCYVMEYYCAYNRNPGYYGPDTARAFIRCLKGCSDGACIP